MPTRIVAITDGGWLGKSKERRQVEAHSITEPPRLDLLVDHWGSLIVWKAGMDRKRPAIASPNTTETSEQG